MTSQEQESVRAGTLNWLANHTTRDIDLVKDLTTKRLIILMIDQWIDKLTAFVTSFETIPVETANWTPYLADADFIDVFGQPKTDGITSYLLGYLVQFSRNYYSGVTLEENLRDIEDTLNIAISDLLIYIAAASGRKNVNPWDLVKLMECPDFRPLVPSDANGNSYHDFFIVNKTLPIFVDSFPVDPAEQKHEFEHSLTMELYNGIATAYSIVKANLGNPGTVVSDETRNRLNPQTQENYPAQLVKGPISLSHNYAFAVNIDTSRVRFGTASDNSEATLGKLDFNSPKDATTDIGHGGAIEERIIPFDDWTLSFFDNGYFRQFWNPPTAYVEGSINRDGLNQQNYIKFIDIEPDKVYFQQGIDTFFLWEDGVTYKTSLKLFTYENGQWTSTPIATNE